MEAGLERLDYEFWPLPDELRGYWEVHTSQASAAPKRALIAPARRRINIWDKSLLHVSAAYGPGADGARRVQSQI